MLFGLSPWSFSSLSSSPPPVVIEEEKRKEKRKEKREEKREEKRKEQKQEQREGKREQKREEKREEKRELQAIKNQAFKLQPSRHKPKPVHTVVTGLCLPRLWRPHSLFQL